MPRFSPLHSTLPQHHSFSVNCTILLLPSLSLPVQIQLEYAEKEIAKEREKLIFVQKGMVDHPHWYIPRQRLAPRSGNISTNTRWVRRSRSGLRTVVSKYLVAVSIRDFLSNGCATCHRLLFECKSYGISCRSWDMIFFYFHARKNIFWPRDLSNEKFGVYGFLLRSPSFRSTCFCFPYYA